MVVIIEYHMAHVTRPNYQHAAFSISSIYAASSISVGERLSFAMMQFSNKFEDFPEKRNVCFWDYDCYSDEDHNGCEDVSDGNAEEMKT